MQPSMPRWEANMPDPIDWQTRALAAEVALESLAEHNDEVAVSRARAEELAEELFHSIKALLLAGGA